MSEERRHSNVEVEIDGDSGFCFGVVTAIRKAEETLQQSPELYCLGDIVHNAGEVERLERKGLHTITHEDLKNLHNVKVLLRAHGEPPTTYQLAQKNGVEVVDATCPVVLRLQRQIKSAYDEGCEARNSGKRPPLILIYGKNGHAEVNGLVGQTNGEAKVIETIDELDSIDYTRDILLYSQTTKSIEGFRSVVEAIEKRRKGEFRYFDTICRQVSNRVEKIKNFSQSHEVVLFVCGSKSSNGKVLFEHCRSVNSSTFMVGDASEVPIERLRGARTIGITGATSTPKWLMQQVMDYVLSQYEEDDRDK